MAAFTDLNLGSAANDGNGTTLRAGGAIINANNAISANTEENNTFDKNVSIEGFFSIGVRVIETIASGVLTITSSNIGVTGEGSTTDDLDTISGGSEGDIIMLSRGTGTITVTESGNILLGDTTRVLSTSGDRLTLHRGGTNWNEISYSDNS